MKKLLLTFLAAVGLLSAAPPTLTQKMLDALAEHWKHVLQLDDWQVSVQAIPLPEMHQGAYGMSEVIAEVQVLHIYVLRPEDYKTLAAREHLVEKRGKAITKDIEDTVVHELLHLRLRVYRMAEQKDFATAEELVVVRLTNALLGKR